MNVETFEQMETTVVGQEAIDSPEALILIDKMNLVGQKKMNQPIDSSSMTKVRCPYREMNITEQRVYETLYPVKTKIQDYESGMIPLRVLQVASHATDLGIYEHVEVWGEKMAPKDPILVGNMGYSKTPHILARWGNALEPFDVLYALAKKTLQEQWAAKIEKKRAECEVFQKSLESNIVLHLGGDWIYLP